MNPHKLRFRRAGRTLTLLFMAWIGAMGAAAAFGELFPGVKSNLANVLFALAIFALFVAMFVVGVLRMIAYMRWTGKYPYANFRFVDWQKRELTRIRDLVLKDFPEVGVAASIELEPEYCDSYQLWFRSEIRSASISVSGREHFPKALFHWDQCGLFSFQVDDFHMLGSVLKRWLHDNALPSAMRTEFPWLPIGELADYYENGNPVEGEFIQSWNHIERFYREYFRLKDLVPPFLAELRRAGYDRKLRAGQQIEMLVLSRSRRHGMRADQPRVVFQFHLGTMDVHCEIAEQKKQIAGIAIALSGVVEEELTKLANQPVD